ncbi:MAG: hypothetical protein LQ338_002757, partial [Usnochroma carphineum]
YQHTEEEMDASSNGHAMATRGRPRPAGAVSQPQVTFPQLNGAQIPQLHPSTTSGNSASTAMSSSRSPRKSRSPTKSRSRSPTKTDTSNGSKATSKKEQLAYSEPMITYEEIKAIKDDDIPESVSTFWKNYIVPVKDEQKVIPEALKASPNAD